VGGRLSPVDSAWLDLGPLEVGLDALEHLDQALDVLDGRAQSLHLGELLRLRRAGPVAR